MDYNLPSFSCASINRAGVAVENVDDAPPSTNAFSPLSGCSLVVPLVLLLAGCSVDSLIVFVEVLVDVVLNSA
jgi:hypothetical protein